MCLDLLGPLQLTTRIQGTSIPLFETLERYYRELWRFRIASFFVNVGKLKRSMTDGYLKEMQADAGLQIELHIPDAGHTGAT